MMGWLMMDGFGHTGLVGCVGGGECGCAMALHEKENTHKPAPIHPSIDRPTDLHAARLQLGGGAHRLLLQRADARVLARQRRLLCHIVVVLGGWLVSVFGRAGRLPRGVWYLW